MDNKLKLLTPDDYIISSWSGGTTTQLAISPADADYAERDFLWRVSSAVVGLESSSFTPLPDYERIISVLEGGMSLRHNGGEPIQLGQYQIHRFDGADETRSEGRCTDFNLMLRKGRCAGCMDSLRVAGGKAAFDILPNVEALLYCCNGSTTAKLGGEGVQLEQGQACYAAQAGGNTLKLFSADAAELMLAQVWRV